MKKCYASHRRGQIGLVCGLLSATAAVIAATEVPAARILETPLEATGFSRLPKAAEVSRFLDRISDEFPNAIRREIGQSALGEPIYALHLSGSNRSSASSASGRKLIALLIAGQHGTEPSGTEALQMLARDSVTGAQSDILNLMDIVLVPMANPDGRNRRKRTNGNGVNLSTDYVTQSQPETRAISSLLREVAPDVILDIHESAIYKKSTLAAQGYMTDFETQWEAQNNPNADAKLRRFAQDAFIPALIKIMNDSAHRSGHYIGEITSINQIITHGGTSLRNLRNYGGMLGALSVLLENRLDPPGTYPTPRNIRSRVRKQLKSIEHFLSTIATHRNRIVELVEGARQDPSQQRVPGRVALAAAYMRDPKRPTIDVMLTALKNGEKVLRRFSYAPLVKTTLSTPLPRYYAVRAHHNQLEEVLNRHGIQFSRLASPRTVVAQILTLNAFESHKQDNHRTVSPVWVAATSVLRSVTLKAGDLWIELNQPRGILVPLVLDPRSSSNVLNESPHRDLLKSGQEYFTIAVP